MTGVALRPIRYASVSGGKDSLYMLKVILENPVKYPLDMVVNFSLEIDWPWTGGVVSAIREMCSRVGVKFVQIRPRRSWDSLYRMYGMPTRQGRWCNSSYKLDCRRQLHGWISQQSCRPVAYISFCADETRRFRYTVGAWNPEEDQDVCYPLAEEGIEESQVLAWARGQKIFRGWYWIFDRQGCMMCPMLTMKELAYLCREYPGKYEEYGRMVMEYEAKGKGNYFHKPWPEVDRTVHVKWLPMVNRLMDGGFFSMVDDHGGTY